MSMHIHHHWVSIWLLVGVAWFLIGLLAMCWYLWRHLESLTVIKVGDVAFMFMMSLVTIILGPIFPLITLWTLRKQIGRIELWRRSGA